jgi:hypothetical protein
MDAYVPTPSTSANTKLGLFGQERFTYAPEKDGYRGPRGEELTLRFDTTALGRHLRYDATGAGRSCPMKAQCTSNNGGRSMTRWVDAHMLERMEERLQATPQSCRRASSALHTPWARSNTPMIRAIAS